MIQQNIKKILAQKKVIQVSVLSSSMVLRIIVGFGISIFNTRFLGVQEYGAYKYLNSWYALATVLIGFGFFFTGSRLLGQERNKVVQSNLMGTLIVIGIFFSFMLTVFFFGFSYIEKYIFEQDLEFYLKLFSPFLFVFLFQSSLERILEGTNSIYKLSILGIAPQILYLVFGFSLNFFFSFSLFWALSLQISTLGFVVIWLLVSLKPSFGNIKSNFRLLATENKKFGFNVYLGSISAVATGHLGAIAIGYFMESEMIAYYSLAITITAPLELVPSAIGKTFFKEFIERDKISNKIFSITFLIAISSLFGFIFLVKYVILFFYSNEYAPSISLSYILAVGNILHGVGNLLNRFLYAKGCGKELRNSAFFHGIINVIGFFVLIKFFGVEGACVTKLLGSSFYFFMMLFFYRIKLKKN